jgi:hypothetical protein
MILKYQHSKVVARYGAIRRKIRMQNDCPDRNEKMHIVFDMSPEAHNDMARRGAIRETMRCRQNPIMADHNTRAFEFGLARPSIGDLDKHSGEAVWIADGLALENVTGISPATIALSIHAAIGRIACQLGLSEQESATLCKCTALWSRRKSQTRKGLCHASDRKEQKDGKPEVPATFHD